MAVFIAVGLGAGALGSLSFYFGWKSHTVERKENLTLGDPPNYLDEKVRRVFTEKVADFEKAIQLEEGRWFISMRSISKELEDRAFDIAAVLLLVHTFLDSQPKSYDQVKKPLEEMVYPLIMLAERLTPFLPQEAKVLKRRVKLITPLSVRVEGACELETRLLSTKERIVRSVAHVQNQSYFSRVLPGTNEGIEYLTSWAQSARHNWDVVERLEEYNIEKTKIETLVKGLFDSKEWTEFKRWFRSAASDIKGELRPILNSEEDSWEVVDEGAVLGLSYN